MKHKSRPKISRSTRIMTGHDSKKSAVGPYLIRVSKHAKAKRPKVTDALRP